MAAHPVHYNAVLEHTRDWRGVRAKAHHHRSDSKRNPGTEGLGPNTHIPCNEHDDVSLPLQLDPADERPGGTRVHPTLTFPALDERLQFFMVNSPWGSPHTAPMKFAKAVDEPIDLYNHGDHASAFTYIDDIVEGLTATDTKVRPVFAPTRYPD